MTAAHWVPRYLSIRSKTALQSCHTARTTLSKFLAQNTLCERHTPSRPPDLEQARQFACSSANQRTKHPVTCNCDVCEYSCYRGPVTAGSLGRLHSMFAASEVSVATERDAVSRWLIDSKWDENADACQKIQRQYPMQRCWAQCAGMLVVQPLLRSQVEAGALAHACVVVTLRFVAAIEEGLSNTHIRIV